METITALAHPEKKDKKRVGLILTIVLLAVLLGVGAFFLMTATGDGDSSSVTSELHHVEIEIEDYGTITVELDASAAPITVANFLSLAESGFYDGLTFHRIIEGFMMQGGDPNGDGSGGSEETIVGEFSDNGYDNPLSHTRGAISMARSSDYDSASSQFFIVQEDSTSLDGQYAVFGYVTDGMDIVDQICADAEPTDDNGTIAEEDQPVITSVTVLD
ncbi:MAG: peptidylprolyl isomerase [Clostridiales bacterium]|nr:peptidylprolyl isomerase [Clostridiales bacterium]